MNLKKCDCKEWKRSIEILNGYLTMGMIHGMGDYQGKPFVYCPWCGKKRKPESKKKNG